MGKRGYGSSWKEDKNYNYEDPEPDEDPQQDLNKWIPLKD